MRSGSKFMAMGVSLEQVVKASTWNPAQAITQDQLGPFSSGAVADVAVLRLDTGNFGFVDHHGARLKGSERVQCELTLRDGKIVYDLNGLARSDWTELPAGYGAQGDSRWDAYAPVPKTPPGR